VEFMFRLMQPAKDNIKVNCNSVQSSFAKAQTTPCIKRFDHFNNQSNYYYSAMHNLYELENLPSMGIKLSVRGNDLSPRGINLSMRGINLSPRGNNLSVRGINLSLGGNDLSVRGNDLSLRGSKLSVRGNDLLPEGNILIASLNSLLTSLGK